MSRAVSIPIMLYNSVWGTVAASPEAQVELTDRGYIQYVKECTGIVTMQQTMGLGRRPARRSSTAWRTRRSRPSFSARPAGAAAPRRVIPSSASSCSTWSRRAGSRRRGTSGSASSRCTVFLEGGKGIQLMKYASKLQGIPIGTARKSRASLTQAEKQKMERMLKDLEVL